MASPGVFAEAGSYQDLLALFKDWQAFERPALRDGAPDYTAATIDRRARANCGVTWHASKPSIRASGRWSSRSITRWCGRR